MSHKMQYDVFICHASEDKDDFVRPLVELLKQQHIEVWYDEFSLSMGDSLLRKIDEGLRLSKFGIVVLSPAFFKKPWAKRELSGLNMREMIEQQDVILPIWHRITIDDVMTFSPPLADKLAVSSASGINVVLREITKKVKPAKSPLIVARDYLESFGLTAPPISDEWWLDMVENKELFKFPDLNSGARWIFPLPFPEEKNGYERGVNIGFSVLQLDWSFEGQELALDPTSHPEEVHAFLHRWPGLIECCRKNPGILALYAPQVTIPGFDQGFEREFDLLMGQGNKAANLIFSYGSHRTVDGKDPLCGDVIAFRHPSFGNYADTELAYWYFKAHNTQFMRSNVDQFEGLIWLLSSHSEWLPAKHRNTLVEGIKKRTVWFSDMGYGDNDFIVGLMNERADFSFTQPVLLALTACIEEVKSVLRIQDSTESLLKKFIDSGMVEAYYDFEEKRELKRKMRSID